MTSDVTRKTTIAPVTTSMPIKEDKITAATAIVNTTTGPNQNVAVISEIVPPPPKVTPAQTSNPFKPEYDNSCRYQPSGVMVQRTERVAQPVCAKKQAQDRKVSRSRMKKNRRCFVQHNYHDHAFFTAEDVKIMVRDADIEGESQMISSRKNRTRHGPKGGVTTPFPLKLHEMLDRIEVDGHGDIISWQPHGRCFLVHNPAKFVSTVMPTYFRQTKLTSFQRQLNLYGFSRLTSGLDKNGYYHELFLRGKPYLTHLMARIRIKGTGTKAASSPSTEPDFYAMPRISQDGRPSIRGSATMVMGCGPKRPPMMISAPYSPRTPVYPVNLQKTPSQSSMGSTGSDRASSPFSPLSSASPVIRPEQRQHISSPRSGPLSPSPAAAIVTPVSSKPTYIPMPPSLASSKQHRSATVSSPPLFTMPTATHHNYQSPSYHKSVTESPPLAALVTPTIKRPAVGCPISPIALPPSLPQLTPSSNPSSIYPNKRNQGYEPQSQAHREHTQQQQKKTKQQPLSSPPLITNTRQKIEPQLKLPSPPFKPSASAVTISKKTTKIEESQDDIITRTPESDTIKCDNSVDTSCTTTEPDEEIMFEGRRFHYIDSLAGCASTIVPFDENEATMSAEADPIIAPVSSEALSPRIVQQATHLRGGQRLSEGSLDDNDNIKLCAPSSGEASSCPSKDSLSGSQKTHSISLDYKNHALTTRDAPCHNLASGNLTPSSSSSSLYDIVGYPDAPADLMHDDEEWGDSVMPSDTFSTVMSHRKDFMDDKSDDGSLMLFGPVLEEQDNLDLSYLLEEMIY